MSAPAPVAPKKKVARRPKKPAAHPPVAKMVVAAIAALKDRKGSSLQAIKKYIAANYKFDVTKQGHVIRRVVRNMLAKGLLTQAKGKGAAGSFRLGAAAKKAPKKRKAKKPKKKAKKPKKARKPKAKKAKKPKAKKAKKAKKPAAKKAARKPAKKTKRVAKK
ncbi:histone H1B, sperm-like [Branchiostoma floridae]|uniref:Histone H1B, sperm-like n=1 Tax=Branchiostoma floridae TaxID=7739 RepID=A0A9J7N9Y0_BRAFL|nr:histone H1B, sperm-like [Branchiostoma floridae]